jgi:hypothetical protein
MNGKDNENKNKLSDKIKEKIKSIDWLNVAILVLSIIIIITVIYQYLKYKKNKAVYKYEDELQQSGNLDSGIMEGESSINNEPSFNSDVIVDVEQLPITSNSKQSEVMMSPLDNSGKLDIDKELDAEIKLDDIKI